MAKQFRHNINELKQYAVSIIYEYESIGIEANLANYLAIRTLTRMSDAGFELFEFKEYIYMIQYILNVYPNE